jgi:hypothetical protein
MLSFKELTKEVYEPFPEDEKEFKNKHVVDKAKHPVNDTETLKGTKKSPVKKKRLADYDNGKDEEVYEEMTTCEKCGKDYDDDDEHECAVKEEIDVDTLQARYGTRWRTVAFAVEASRTAMKDTDDAPFAGAKKAKPHKDRFGNVIKDKNVPKHLAKKAMKNEDVNLDEAQKMFMFKTKAEAEEKAKQIKGVMTQLGPKNFMVVTKDLTKVPSKAKMKFGKYKDVTPKGYGPNEELDESAAGIAQLKKAYEPMRGTKISLDNAKKLSAIMDKFADDEAMLIKLVKADIPFVTQSAVTKLITKHNMKGAEINKMMKEGNAFGMALKEAKEKGDLDEAFKISATNQKLNDGSMVNISKDDASALNSLYNKLNSDNRKKMEEKLKGSKTAFAEILAFAKQAV